MPTLGLSDKPWAHTQAENATAKIEVDFSVKAASSEKAMELVNSLQKDSLNSNLLAEVR